METVAEASVAGHAEALQKRRPDMPLAGSLWHLAVGHCLSHVPHAAPVIFSSLFTVYKY